MQTQRLVYRRAGSSKRWKHKKKRLLPPLARTNGLCAGASTATAAGVALSIVQLLLNRLFALVAIAAAALLNAHGPGDLNKVPVAASRVGTARSHVRFGGGVLADKGVADLRVVVHASEALAALTSENVDWLGNNKVGERSALWLARASAVVKVAAEVGGVWYTLKAIPALATCGIVGACDHSNFARGTCSLVRAKRVLLTLGGANTLSIGTACKLWATVVACRGGGLEGNNVFQRAA